MEYINNGQVGTSSFVLVQTSLSAWNYRTVLYIDLYIVQCEVSDVLLQNKYIQIWNSSTCSVCERLYSCLEVGVCCCEVMLVVTRVRHKGHPLASHMDREDISKLYSVRWVMK